MNIQLADITHDSVVDGPGLRTVVWFSGCSHNCYECHNPELQDFDYGSSVSVKELADKLSGVRKITFSGGDPLFQLEALDELVGLLDPNVDIWIYTGFMLGEVGFMLGSTKHLQYRDFIIKCGPYVKTFRDVSCLYRGSSNQRIYKYSNNNFKDISDEIDGKEVS